MNHESTPLPDSRQTHEVFGLTEQEHRLWRVNDSRFQEILANDQTLVHSILDSENAFGEYLFITTSRPGQKERAAITFYGLGYHEQRERWITREWFWYETMLNDEKLDHILPKQEVQETLDLRRKEIAPLIERIAQSEQAKFFELFADLTDDDAALAETEDFASLDAWLDDLERAAQNKNQAASECLLDPETQSRLPPLYTNEELGLNAKAQVKFFTPDSNWSWYASEFDGKDIFFGLVSGLEVELGYFSLKEIQEAQSLLGIKVERDTNFEPKSLDELLKNHKQASE